MRGYLLGNDQKEIENIDGISYSLAFQFVKSILSIEIKTKVWERKTNTSLAPPIIFLIEDYFKIASINWFYLETLNEQEIESVENIPRRLDPLKIVLGIKEIDFNQNSLKPKFDLSTKSGSFNMDYYSGIKSDFGNLVNFWISFIGGVTPSEFTNFEMDI